MPDDSGSDLRSVAAGMECLHEFIEFNRDVIISRKRKRFGAAGGRLSHGRGDCALGDSAFQRLRVHS